jgi:hypothetical protein
MSIKQSVQVSVTRLDNTGITIKMDHQVINSRGKLKAHWI